MLAGEIVLFIIYCLRQETGEVFMDILGIGESMIEMDAEVSLAASTVFTRQVGGDVYNTLVALSRLGSQSGFLSRVTMDAFGEVLLKHYADYKVDSRYVHRATEGQNGLYFTTLKPDGSHEYLYYRKNSVATQISPHQITSPVIQETQIVYASGITQAISNSARQAVLKAFQIAKAQGKLVAYDPNYRQALWQHKDKALEALVEVLPYLDIIFPSEEDLRSLFNFQDIDHMLEYFRLREVPVVALKRGKNGAILAFKKQQEKIEPYPMNPIKDAIGTGDAFNGGFLHGLLKNKSLSECAQIGAITAAFSLRETGPILGLPTWSEVSAVLNQRQPLTATP